MTSNGPRAGLKTLNHRHDWTSSRLKFLFKRETRPVLETDEVITAFRDGMVTLRKNRREDGFTFAEQEIGYQGVDPGDLVIHAMDGFAGAIGVSDSRGKGSPVLSIATPIADVETRFWAYYLRNLAIAGFIQSLAKGIRERSTDFRWKDASNLLVNFPDLPTQRAIADFLDRETARIDLLIEKKQRLVELLGEIYFSELESRTFPENVPTDELMPFRWVCRIAEGQVDPTSDTWRHRILIAPNHIESKTGRLLSTETAEEQGAISGKYAFSKGTVLYSKIRPALAKACISESVGMCSADMYPIMPDKRLRPEYLLMQLLSARFTDWATIESMRVAMPKINRETLGGFRLRVPPIAQQDAFIEIFQKNRVRFESVTDKVHASINRLKEYRSALITAAVTGQIDVTEYTKSGTTDRRLDAIQEEMGA